MMDRIREMSGLTDKGSITAENDIKTAHLNDQKEKVIADLESIDFKLVKERELKYHYLLFFERETKN